MGFIFGAITWLRNLLIGDNAPLRVIQDSIKLLGYVIKLKPMFSLCSFYCFIKTLTDGLEVVCRDGTIPCITLILGGNLIQGNLERFLVGHMYSTLQEDNI